MSSKPSAAGPERSRYQPFERRGSQGDPVWCVEDTQTNTVAAHTGDSHGVLFEWADPAGAQALCERIERGEAPADLAWVAMF